MFSTLFQPCGVKLHLLQNVVFLHPPESGLRPTDPEDAPPVGDDELIRGLFELQVPSDRHIGGIRVRLRASETVGILDDPPTLVPIGWEQRTIMERTLEIGVPARNSATLSRASYSRAASRGPRSASRAPNGSSRAPSPQRRDSLESNETETRGRDAAVRDEHQGHRDQGVGGLASALAAAMRGRSRSKPARRPPSPPARGRSSTTAPTTRSRDSGDGFQSSPLTGRRSYSTSRQTRFGVVDEEEYRGRAFHSPSVVPEGGASAVHDSSTFTSNQHQHHHHHLSHLFSHHGPHHNSTSSRSSSVGLIGRATSRSRALNEAASHEDADSAVEVSDDDEGMFVGKGIHGFEFGFILPCNAPSFERSPYGRVQYTIKATVIGGGRAKSNIEAHREIYPMTVPSIESPATSLAVMYHDLHSTVGLLSIACTSNNISVGGIFNIDVHSPSPPPDLIVYMVRVSLETTVDLYTVKRGKQTVPIMKHRLFEQGMIPLRLPEDLEVPQTKEQVVKWCGNDHAWSVQGIARMPDDNVIRPTTLVGSKGDIRYSHTLSVEVIHSRDPTLEDLPADSPRKLKAFTLRQPVIIPSCCVAYSAVTLPRYEEKGSTSSVGPTATAGRVPEALLGTDSSSPWAITAGPVQPAGHDICVCGMSLADLEARERNIIPRTPGYDVPVDSVRHQGKVGEYNPINDSAAQRNASSLPSSSTSASLTVPSRTSSSSVSPARSRAPSRERPSPNHSASSRSSWIQSMTPATPSTSKEGAPHVASFHTGTVRDNLDGYSAHHRMPLAPTPGGSGMNTPIRGMSRSRSRVRTVHHPDLSEAIPRLNDLVEAHEHEPSLLPPAYDTIVDVDGEPNDPVLYAEDETRGRAATLRA